MKLLRFGSKEAEKPAVLHTDGTIRDIFSIIVDLKPETISPAGLGLDKSPPVFLKAGDITHLGITGFDEQIQKVISR